MAVQVEHVARNAGNRFNTLINENFRENTELELQKFLDKQKSFRRSGEKSRPELHRSLSLPPPQRKKTVPVFMKSANEVLKTDVRGNQNISGDSFDNAPKNSEDKPTTRSKCEEKSVKENKKDHKEYCNYNTIIDEKKTLKKNGERCMPKTTTGGEQKMPKSTISREQFMPTPTIGGEQYMRKSITGGERLIPKSTTSEKTHVPLNTNQTCTSKKYHVVNIRETASKQRKQIQSPCTSLEEDRGRYSNKNDKKKTCATADSLPLLRKLRTALVVWNDNETCVTSDKMMQQVDIYVNWINGQLQKRPNSRKVTHLAEDMKDGVAFLQLVEVISQEKQDIIDGDSLSLSDMRCNLATVLHFLSKNNIRVHHILPKEIMEGKLKGTMRLVLALAAHFKPESFKNQNFHQTPERITKTSHMYRATSLISLASNAAASLVEASRNANNSGIVTHFKHRNQTSTPKRPRPVFSASSPSSSHPRTIPRWKTGNLRMDNAEIPDLCNASSIPKSSQLQSHPSSSSIESQENDQRETTFMKKIEEKCSDDDCPEIIQRHDVILDDVAGTKEVLVQLQELLLNGCTPEEQLGITSSNNDSFQEQLVMKNIILEQKVEECDDFKSQLNELKEINMTLTGDKRALETRVSQQEQLILTLKSKLLQYEINSKTTNEREFEILLHERDKELHLLHEEMTKRDDIIQKQKAEIDTLSNNIVTKQRTEASLHARIESSESMVSNLRMQVQELSNRLHNASLYQNNNQAAGTNMESLRNRISEAKFLKEKQKIFREHKNMKVTLKNVKQRFKPDDPVQHAFQSMEQSMMSLEDIVVMMENSTPAKESRPAAVPRAYPVNIKSPTSSDSGYDHNGNTSLDGGEQIKVVYYLGKSITPVLKMTDIGLGFFTLKDFKQLVKRPGSYRYFFKAVDRDFGFVREELLFDDDIVPGHENKIVAWMEKRIGEEV